MTATMQVHNVIHKPIQSHHIVIVNPSTSRKQFELKMETASIRAYFLSVNAE